MSDKRRVPSLWEPDPWVGHRARAANIPDNFITKCIEKYRGDIFNVEKGLSQCFYERLCKAWQTYQRRSAGQKNRHRKVPEHNSGTYQPPDPNRVQVNADKLRSDIAELKRHLLT